MADRLREQLQEESTMDVSNLLVTLEADYLREKRLDPTSHQHAMNYAIQLIRSQHPRQGLDILMEILSRADGATTSSREMKYHLALANFKLGNLDTAETYLAPLLSEPSSSQPHALAELIREQRQRDRERQQQMAMVGGAAVAVGVIGAAVLAVALAKR